MLISERHRFLFVHVYKNAGTSVTHALRPFCTNLWLYRADNLLRRCGASLPYYTNPSRHEKHITAPDLVTKIGLEVFKSYFSFAFIRNPWDWQVSLYNYMLNSPDHRQHGFVVNLGGFGAYLKWRCNEEIRYQKDFIYAKDGTKLVDFVGRFEQVEEDFAKICSRIGISARLPKLNVSKAKPYQEYYDHELIELVRRAFEPDISLFNYDF